jgi:hypothetical protein
MRSMRQSCAERLVTDGFRAKPRTKYHQGAADVFRESLVSFRLWLGATVGAHNPVLRLYSRLSVNTALLPRGGDPMLAASS